MMSRRLSFQGDYMRWVLLAQSLFFVVEPAFGDEPKSGGKTLFNGKDLSGWDTWLGRPFQEKKEVGLNDDPKKVYTVVEADGKPAIRISGEIFGALTSKDEF